MCTQFIKKNVVKFENLLSRTSKDDLTSDLEGKSKELSFWHPHPSYSYFRAHFSKHTKTTKDLKEHCTNSIFSSIVRGTHPLLASDDIKFSKNIKRVFKTTRFYTGLKTGIALVSLLWLLADSVVATDFRFWEQSGIYMYTTVGNIILCRFMWYINVSTWIKYKVSCCFKFY